MRPSAALSEAVARAARERIEQPRTLAIAEACADAVRGRADRYKTWNEHVHE